MISFAWVLLVFQIALSFLLLLRKFSPNIFYQLIPTPSLIKEGRWDQCDGEPLNHAAIEFDRRQGNF